MTLAWIVIIVTARAGTAQPAARVDAFVRQALAEWGTPGLVLSIVKDDAVVSAKGYGLREMGRPEPVDENTLFAIGSCSKAFTSAGVSLIVDEAKIGWNERVTSRLPWFGLWNVALSPEVTVRDLLAHRIGTDLLDEDRAFSLATDRRDVVRRVRFVPPAAGLRERYVYSNAMFVAAGQLIEEVSGQSWEAFLRSRIWAPLGMRSTNANLDAARATSNRASGHFRASGGLKIYSWEAVPDRDSLYRGTGGINSTAHDMAQWLRVQLGRGRYQGRQLIDSMIFAEMHTPHIAIVDGPRQAAYWFQYLSAADLDTKWWSYGLGWFVMQYRGRQIVWHGGTSRGFRCAIALAPEARLGIYVGTNEANLLPPAMMFQVLDEYLGVVDRQWSQVFLQESARQARAAQDRETRRTEARIPNTTPSREPAGYAGAYIHQSGDTARVTVVGERLAVSIGPRRGNLQHWHHDVFEIEWLTQEGGRSFGTFVIGPSGRVETARIDGLGEYQRRD